MDREHDARGCRSSGHWLCRAAGRLRACLPRSTGLRGPAALSAAGRLPSPASARGPNCRLAGSGSSPGSRAGATAPSATGCRAAADGGRGSCRPTSHSSRGDPSRPEPLLCLDAGLLGLEWRLGMGWRPMGGPSEAHCRLGGRPLGTSRPRLRVDRRWLAIAPHCRVRRQALRKAACESAIASER